MKQAFDLNATNLKAIIEKVKAIVYYHKLTAEEKNDLKLQVPIYLSNDEIKLITAAPEVPKEEEKKLTAEEEKAKEEERTVKAFGKNKQEEFYTKCAAEKSLLIDKLELIPNINKVCQIQKVALPSLDEFHKVWLLQHTIELLTVITTGQLYQILGFETAQTEAEISNLAKRYKFFFHGDKLTKLIREYNNSSIFQKACNAFNFPENAGDKIVQEIAVCETTAKSAKKLHELILQQDLTMLTTYLKITTNLNLIPTKERIILLTQAMNIKNILILNTLFKNSIFNELLTMPALSENETSPPQQLIAIAYSNKDVPLINYLLTFIKEGQNFLLTEAINNFDSEFFQQLLTQGLIQLENILTLTLPAELSQNITVAILSIPANQNDVKKFNILSQEIKKKWPKENVKPAYLMITKTFPGFMKNYIAQYAPKSSASQTIPNQQYTMPPQSQFFYSDKPSTATSSFPFASSNSPAYSNPYGSHTSSSPYNSSAANSSAYFYAESKKRRVDNCNEKPAKKPKSEYSYLKNYQYLINAIDKNDATAVLQQLYPRVKTFLKGSYGYEALAYAYENCKNEAFKILKEYVNQDDPNVIALLHPKIHEFK